MPKILDAVRHWATTIFKKVSAMAFHTSHRDRRPFLVVHLTGLRGEISALLDTGSSISLLKTEKFAEMKLDHKLRPTNARVTDAQDGNLACIGTVDVNVKGGDNLDVMVTMYVVKGLSAEAILGMDFITDTGLIFNAPEGTVEYRFPKGRSEMAQEDGEEEEEAYTTHSVQTLEPVVLEPGETVWVPLKLETPSHMKVATGAEVVLTGNDGSPIMHPDCMVTVTKGGLFHIPMMNGLPIQMTLAQGQRMDMEATISEKHEVMQISTAVSEIMRKQKDEGSEVLTKEKRDYLLKHLDLSGVPQGWRQAYTKVVLDNHQAFSDSKYDLGYCNRVQHTIYLEDDKPVFVPQFRLPREHEEAIEEAVIEWLRAGVIYKTRSRYNTPIFAVKKPGGGLRIVQDLRAINKKSAEDQYSIRDVRGTLDDLGQMQPKVFNTLDMSGAFHQCALAPGVSQAATAFTLTSQNLQYAWKTTPMGLKGATATFSRLMGEVFQGVQGVITYVDDILVHAKSHAESVRTLDTVFKILMKNNLKLNLKKCHLGRTSVDFLGHKIDENGMAPSLDKVKAVAELETPKKLQQVQGFLGFANSFRQYIPRLDRLLWPLVNLTRQDNNYRKGEIPREARIAFKKAIREMMNPRTLAWPNPNKPFILSTDASGHTEKDPGGIGAILSQGEGKDDRPVAFFSRQLKGSEKNYSAIQLESLAISAALDHFHPYVYENKGLTVYTDHKPVEYHADRSDKILSRLQEKIGKYGAQVVHRKGPDNAAADYLSRNAVVQDDQDPTPKYANMISDNMDEIAYLRREQAKDKVINEILIPFVEHKKLPMDTIADRRTKALLSIYGKRLRLENGVLYIEEMLYPQPQKMLRIWCPGHLRHSVIEEAHEGPLGGHWGIHRTAAKIYEKYFWPSVVNDVSKYIDRCSACQRTKPTPINERKQTMQSWKTPPIRNYRVGMDLTGPYTSFAGCEECAKKALTCTCKARHPTTNKYVMSMVDAFTGWAEFAIIPNKTAEEVAKAFYKSWICTQAEPVEILHDGGKEFVNSLAYSLAKLYNIRTRVTSARHPQSNGKTERIHSPLKRYLTAFVREDTMDWEMFLHSFKLAHNTAISATTGKTPYEMTYGEHPNRNRPIHGQMRQFPTADKTSVQGYIERLKQAIQRGREEAEKILLQQREKQKQQYDKHSSVNIYQVGDRVLLFDDRVLPNTNGKLKRDWRGPYVILRCLKFDNYWIKPEHAQGTKGALKVHINRLRLYKAMDDFDNEVSIIPKDEQHDRMTEARDQVMTPLRQIEQKQPEATRRVKFNLPDRQPRDSGEAQATTQDMGTARASDQAAAYPVTPARPTKNARVSRRLSYGQQQTPASTQQSPLGPRAEATPIEQPALRRSERLAAKTQTSTEAAQTNTSNALMRSVRLYEPCLICGERCEDWQTRCICGAFLTPTNEYQENIRQHVLSESRRYYTWIPRRTQQRKEKTRDNEERATAPQETGQQIERPQENSRPEGDRRGQLQPEDRGQGPGEAAAERPPEAGGDSNEAEAKNDDEQFDITELFDDEHGLLKPTKRKHTDPDTTVHRDTPRPPDRTRGEAAHRERTGQSDDQLSENRARYKPRNLFAGPPNSGDVDTTTPTPRSPSPGTDDDDLDDTILERDLWSDTAGTFEERGEGYDSLLAGGDTTIGGGTTTPTSDRGEESDLGGQQGNDTSQDKGHSGTENDRKSEEHTGVSDVHRQGGDRSVKSPEAGPRGTVGQGQTPIGGLDGRQVGEGSHSGDRLHEVGVDTRSEQHVSKDDGQMATRVEEKVRRTKSVIQRKKVSNLHELVGNTVISAEKSRPTSEHGAKRQLTAEEKTTGIDKRRRTAEVIPETEEKEEEEESDTGRQGPRTRSKTSKTPLRQLTMKGPQVAEEQSPPRLQRSQSMPQ